MPFYVCCGLFVTEKRNWNKRAELFNHSQLTADGVRSRKPASDPAERDLSGSVCRVLITKWLANCLAYLGIPTRLWYDFKDYLAYYTIRKTMMNLTVRVAPFGLPLQV